MFNNAGISSSRSRFIDDELQDFDRVIGVNLFGVMVCSQRAARHMAANGGGAIVNTASIAGINVGAGLISYRVSKAAVIHFSRSIAIDLAEHGIRVNCLAPAHIATAINTDYDVAQIIRLMQPLQRAGTPHDVAERRPLPGERPGGADHRGRAPRRRRDDRRPAGQPAANPPARARRRGDEMTVRHR